jgi:hypothetical protein
MERTRTANGESHAAKIKDAYAVVLGIVAYGLFTPWRVTVQVRGR